MLIVPTWLMKNSHVPLLRAVRYSILHLFILKDGQIDLNLKAPSWTHWFVTATGCSHHCWVYRALITSSIRTPTLKDVEPPGEPLGILGALCHWHHLLCPMEHWAQASSVLLTSPLDAPSFKPHIKSSTLQAPPKDWMALLDDQGCPSLLTFILLFMTATAIGWWPSCTIFAVTSTCAVLPAQLTGPVKLNPMSLALI